MIAPIVCLFGSLIFGALAAAALSGSERDPKNNFGYGLIFVLGAVMCFFLGIAAAVSTAFYLKGY